MTFYTQYTIAVASVQSTYAPIVFYDEVCCCGLLLDVLKYFKVSTPIEIDGRLFLS